MKHIKAAFFDIDGTIYTHRNHDFPKRTRQTLQMLRNNGIKIVSATSRCRYEVKNLPSFYKTFGFDAQIYDGGALVLEQEHIVSQQPIDKQEVKALLAYAQEHHIPVRYSTFAEDYMHTLCEPHILDEFFRLYLNYPEVKPYADETVYNLLAYPHNEQQKDAIIQLLTHTSIVEHSSKTLEITAQDVGKDSGVAALCAHWGMGLNEIVCFGDGANDVGMLKAAGIGIAMENGNAKAKAAADYVCGHIDEDGLYHICKELNLI